MSGVPCDTSTATQTTESLGCTRETNGRGLFNGSYQGTLSGDIGLLSNLEELYVKFSF